MSEAVRKKFFSLITVPLLVREHCKSFASLIVFFFIFPTTTNYPYSWDQMNKVIAKWYCGNSLHQNTKQICKKHQIDIVIMPGKNCLFCYLGRGAQKCYFFFDKKFLKCSNFFSICPIVIKFMVAIYGIMNFRAPNFWARTGEAAKLRNSQISEYPTCPF